jgi:LAO/AO transport system kinase
MGIEASELRRIARAISAVENQADGCEEILRQAYRQRNRAAVIGITGPPGSGKSTLIDALASHWAAAGERIAILAIDPSSPYSGGAVLGDRIRRTRSAGLDNIYFRSLSSRGHVGGLSETTSDLVAVLGQFAFRRVVIETVGAGQSDIEIHAMADCTIVLATPGFGDGIQASKAGLMEIGDLFAVNKADVPGADDAARAIELALAAAYVGQPGINLRDSPMTAGAAAHAVTPGLAALHRRHGNSAADESVWVPPVLKVVATESHGVVELAEMIDGFVAWTDETGRRQQRGRDRAYAQVMRALTGLLLAPYARDPASQALPPKVAPWIERVADGAASPIEAARALLDE